jgi:predicted HicB family RNase H-like nuclease
MTRKPVISESLAAEAKAPLKVEERPTVVGMTFYIPKPTHRRMKQIALDRETSLQKLVEEALDMWLAAQGEAPFRPE